MFTRTCKSWVGLFVTPNILSLNSVERRGQGRAKEAARAEATSQEASRGNTAHHNTG